MGEYALASPAREWLGRPSLPTGMVPATVTRCTEGRRPVGERDVRVPGAGAATSGGVQLVDQRVAGERRLRRVGLGQLAEQPSELDLGPRGEVRLVAEEHHPVAQDRRPDRGDGRGVEIAGNPDPTDLGADPDGERPDVQPDRGRGERWRGIDGRAVDGHGVEGRDPSSFRAALSPHEWTAT